MRRVLSGGICVKRYGLRSTGETDTHDYIDKDLSRKGAAPATGRDTLINPFQRSIKRVGTVHNRRSRPSLARAL